MENPLVIGILDIVEDKLREFGVMLPDDDREESKDPIVGYHYAELHDRIQEFLEEKGLVKPDGTAVRVEDKKKVFVLTCVHETKYGASCYGSVHPSYQDAMDHVEVVQQECDFEENNDREYFNFDIDEDVIDVLKLTPVQSLSISEKDMDDLADRGTARLRAHAKEGMKSLDSQITIAKASYASTYEIPGADVCQKNESRKAGPEI